MVNSLCFLVTKWAMENPNSYICSNIIDFVNLLKVCRYANPQPAILGFFEFNRRYPFLKKIEQKDPRVCMLQQRRQVKQLIILIITFMVSLLLGWSFFTVCGPWGRPDMASLFFTKDISKKSRLRSLKPLIGAVFLGVLVTLMIS